MATLRPFHTMGSFAVVNAAFGDLEVDAIEGQPVQDVLRDMARWNAASARSLARIPSQSAAGRLLAISAVISDCLKLVRRIDTVAIDEWLTSPSTPAEEAVRFRAVRSGLTVRYDALVELLGEVATAADIARPSDMGNLRSLRRNTAKLMQLLGARGPASRLTVVLSGLILLYRERVLARSVLGRLVRSHPRLPFGRANARLAGRINDRVGFAAVDYTRGEDLRVAYAALRSKGVRGAAADAWVVRALRTSHERSGRAWKGLLRLTELLTHGDLDPAHPGFGARLDASMTDAIHTTHVPGAEIIVRDYRIGAMLAVQDGKVDKTTGRVALTQGGGSVIPGIFRHSPAGIAAGRKYVEPLDRFMRSMVTADGDDHKAQKGAFNRYFGWGPVLETTPFVEATLARLLDQAARIAAAQQGVFDFKMDFAFHFPITIICHMLGVSQRDAPNIQRWTEDFVRALDAGTGISPAHMAAGNRANQQLEHHLRGLIDAARRGEEVPGIIGDLARKQLPFSDEVLLANLIVLIFAGFETTTGLLSMGVNELLQRREQWEYLRSRLVTGPELEVDGERVRDQTLRWSLWSEGAAALDPDAKERLALLQSQLARSPALVARRAALDDQEKALEAAVEEMLRYTAPGSVIPLALNEDLEIVAEEEIQMDGRVCPAGTTITLEKGKMVTVAVDELNRRCPMGAGQFDSGTGSAFDVSRADNRSHLSFGRAHSCLGARLAKENTKRALQAVLQRFPDLELAGRPEPQQFDLFNGLATLPVCTALFDRR